MENGDYVRVINTLNEYVEITKIKRILEHPFNYKTFLDVRDNEYDCDEIIKSSPNIIDLIEVGDYVNGCRVYELGENCIYVGYKCFKTKFNDEEEYIYQTIYKEDIKSIVTKEQFEAIKYEIK